MMEVLYYVSCHWSKVLHWYQHISMNHHNVFYYKTIYINPSWFIFNGILKWIKVRKKLNSCRFKGVSINISTITVPFMKENTHNPCYAPGSLTSKSTHTHANTHTNIIPDTYTCNQIDIWIQKGKQTCAWKAHKEVFMHTHNSSGSRSRESSMFVYCVLLV